MAADSATLGIIGAAASGPDIGSGCSPTRSNTGPLGAIARHSAESGPSRTNVGAEDARSSAPQSAQSSSDGSSAGGAGRANSTA
ncbi:MAG: hypothetical protein ACRET5_19625, partial [Steroidobacteraceae bacterium]